jgi:hypothetical protein
VGIKHGLVPLRELHEFSSSLLAPVFAPKTLTDTSPNPPLWVVAVQLWPVLSFPVPVPPLCRGRSISLKDRPEISPSYCLAFSSSFALAVAFSLFFGFFYCLLKKKLTAPAHYLMQCLLH